MRFCGTPPERAGEHQSHPLPGRVSGGEICWFGGWGCRSLPACIGCFLLPRRPAAERGVPLTVWPGAMPA